MGNNSPLKKVASAAEARKNSAKKRSLPAVNEHFEPDFDAESASAVVFQRAVKGCPALVVAGTQSGSGKTTVTVGLMRALAARGLTVQPFKCGPDFIDPSLHRLATGRLSRNLDLWMCGEAFVRETFARHSRTADIAVIEGVMGMFDGGESSTAALAKALGASVVLVLDIQAAAESAAAIVKGFETLDPAVAPRGIILNRVGSDRHLQLAGEAIRKHCQAEILGALPRRLDFAMPSRHLGLVMGGEEPLSPAALDRLAEAIAGQVDLAGLLDLAATNHGPAAPAVPEVVPRAMPGVTPPVLARIGVARDEAFCFYYEDNFDLLRQAGAELVFFSPLRDPGLPEGIGGLYLGGGYPELHAEALAGNTRMRQAIRAWAEAGRPIYAECGGFMYLTEGIVDDEGRVLPMAGIFPVTARMQKSRASLGYREVRLQGECCLGAAGARLRGHEFHYSTISGMPESIARLYTLNDGRAEGYRYKQVLGGYIHLHFGGTPQAAAELVKFCRDKR